MSNFVKIKCFGPTRGGQARRVQLFFGVCILTLCILRGPGDVFAAVGHEFSRYQLILDKKPFGEVTPSEVSQPQAALGDVVAKEIEMKSIVDDGAGMRIGLLDKKTNKNVSLGVGENYEGIQLVSVDYDNEEAVLQKGGEKTVVKLHQEKDKDKNSLLPIAAAGTPATATALPVSPFAAAMDSSSAGRKPFFADFKKRRITPFQPLGTNAIPFQSRPLDSFFKVSTGAFPQAQSPFGPFTPSQGSAPSGGLQQMMTVSSNTPNPFMPVAPNGGQVNPFSPGEKAEGKGATINQLLQEQVNPNASAEAPAEEVAQ